MTEAARQILEAATVGGPDNLTDAEMRRIVWGLAKIQPLVLDKIDGLERHNNEQDDYIFVFKVSWCCLRWALAGKNRKYVLAGVFLIVNTIIGLTYMARCWT